MPFEGVKIHAKFVSSLLRSARNDRRDIFDSHKNSMNEKSPNFIKVNTLAWGMGNGDEGDRRIINAQCPIPNSQFPIPKLLLFPKPEIETTSRSAAVTATRFSYLPFIEPLIRWFNFALF
jgi:hypothetical protein